MSFVLLWTDLLMWLFVATLIGGIYQIRQSREACRKWRKIFQSHIAVASALILAGYFVIALLDSIHFERSPSSIVEMSSEEAEALDVVTRSRAQLSGVYSAFDWLFAHVKMQQERTYSAPFATHEYSTSLHYDQSGNVQQNYLQLQFGGQHLLDDTGVMDDVLVRSTVPFLTAFALLFVWMIVHLLYVSNQPPSIHKPLPWLTIYATSFILLFALFWFYHMSQFYHVLGTDKVGQSVLYQSLKSIRTGVLIGLLTTLVMLPLALVLGISAGYFKGWVDDGIQYVYTTLNSIPGVLLIAAAVLVMQTIINNNSDWFTSTDERADLRLLFLIFILGLTSWTGLCRLLRAETLKISQIEYVSAAKAFGLSHYKIIKNHIMPNLLHLVIIAIVLDFSALVLAEAVLSYVGVGVDPTTASWGNMINQARLEMAREPMVWWSLSAAFVFMFVLVLAANLFSDRLQAVLDPRRVS